MSHAGIVVVLAAALAAPVAEPTVVLAPAPDVAPAVAPTVAPVPAPPSVPGRDQQRRRAEDLVMTGAVCLGLGGASLLLIVGPAHALYQRSLEAAEDARWVTAQDELLAEAQRRRTVVLFSAGLGAALTTAGAVLVGVGLSRRARLRRPSAATLSIAPTIGGGHYGVGASARF